MPPKPYASIDTIIEQPEEHLRKAMTALCADDKVREKAYLFVLKLARHAKELEVKNAAPGNTSKGVKRDLKTMLDVEICIRCNQTFHEDDNNAKNCWHHDCDLEVDPDSDVWVEWDECHGDIDTETNRKSFPDGFIYGCCEKLGTSTGCKWGEHLPAMDPEWVSLQQFDRHIANLKRVKLAATKKTPVVQDVKPPASKTCVQCKVEFYDKGNGELSCSWHDGTLGLDSTLSVWEDFDRDSDGELDTDDMRQDHPEGFEWDCCDKLGDSMGCKQARHKAAEDSEIIEISDDE